MTSSPASLASSRAALQLRSLVKPSGELEVSLVDVEVPRPGPGDVVVRIDASPVNPSDLGLLFGPADLATLVASGSAERPVVTARVPDRLMRGLAARVGKALPVGNEGAGVVVEAGDAPEAKALLGKTVALLGGAMYAQYRVAPAVQCLVLDEGTKAADAASAFINPLTALCMLETMRHEGHTALVHTAAASSLGQMLQKVCLADGVSLVNVVRKKEQAELLRGIGATHVCDSSADTFEADLTRAVADTGATLAFDAIGGGKIAGQILSAMERAAAQTSDRPYSPYGSTTPKQVYVYGALDPSPTSIARDFGLTWSLAGWLVTPYLQKLGPEVGARLKKRIAAELTTTFATTYAKQVSLAGLLAPAEIAAYAKASTGGKYLVTPNA